MEHKRCIIIPYNRTSCSAKLLQKELAQKLQIPVLRVQHTSTKYQPRPSDYIINWGCSKDFTWNNTNNTTNYKNCINKLHFFEHITAHNKVFPEKHINIPEWTTSIHTACEWHKNKQEFVVRTILNGHSGAGIYFIPKWDGVTEYDWYKEDHPGIDLSTAPLYVQYKKKRHEYRVHFFKEGNNYKIIDVVQKKKKKEFVNHNTQIRSYKNGWIFARENITEPPDLRTQALNAAFASRLPFGAIDIIWNKFENKCYILEINTAPGIEGTTLLNYVESFVKEILK